MIEIEMYQTENILIVLARVCFIRLFSFLVNYYGSERVEFIALMSFSAFYM